MGCAIIGCGKALPALEIANNDFIQLVDTNDEWITKLMRPAQVLYMV